MAELDAGWAELSRVAAEVAALSRAQILSHASIAVLAQTKQMEISGRPLQRGCAEERQRRIARRGQRRRLWLSCAIAWRNCSNV